MRVSFGNSFDRKRSQQHYIYNLNTQLRVSLVQGTPLSSLRRSGWCGRFSIHEQQSALLSLSAIADCVQFSPSSSSPPAAAAAEAATMFSTSFVYGSQSSVPTLQVREVLTYTLAIANGHAPTWHRSGSSWNGLLDEGDRCHEYQCHSIG